MKSSSSREFLIFPKFDIGESVVIREPEVYKQGYWVGAPSVTGLDGNIYLTYRIRRPKGKDKNELVMFGYSRDKKWEISRSTLV